MPTELPRLPDLEQVEAGRWAPTRTQMALMLLAGFSGYVRWPIFYLLLLALAWISLEAERPTVLGLSLRWDFRHWIWLVSGSALFLLAPFEAGRWISLIIEYLSS